MKLTVSLPFGSPPCSTTKPELRTWPHWLKDKEVQQSTRALHYDYDYSDYSERENKIRRRQET